MDLLVLNAGLLQRDELNSLDFYSIQQQFEVNALGPLRVVDSLRSQLRSGSKASTPRDLPAPHTEVLCR